MFFKKGFIHHPYVMIVIAFFVGLLVMFFIAKGIIPLPEALGFLKP